MSAVSLREQHDAFEALAELAEAWPGLPGAYVTVSQYRPGHLDVMADSQTAFEAWREALMVPSDTVELHPDSVGQDGTLEFFTVLAGVTARVYVRMTHLPLAVAS